MKQEQIFNRLIWQCRRGKLELDLILGGFLTNYYSACSEEQMRAFEKLLTHHDDDLSDWLIEKKPCENNEIVSIINKIKELVKV